MNQESSDDEDVFCCGRCKMHFSSMECFLEHKKSQVCSKTKRRPEKQEQKESATSCVPTNVAEIQDVQSSTPECHLQSSFNRLQDHPQGAHTPGKGDSSSHVESQDGKSIVYLTRDVLDKLLGSPHAEPPSTRTDIEMSTLNSRGRGDANKSTHAASGSRSKDYRTVGQTNRVTATRPSRGRKQPPTNCEEVRSADNELVDESSVSMETEVSSRSNKPSSDEQRMPSVLKPGEQFHSQESQSGPGEKNSKVHQKSAKVVSSPLNIPEGLKSSRPVECTFCSQTMKNADGLFSHYMEIHMMKSEKALEFLRQFAFKRKRGRPTKGITVKKPTMCPHCSEVFTSKNMCTVHIRKQHPSLQREKATAAPKGREILSGRLRKCSRCGFQTTTAKDLTAHIHSCHGNSTDVTYKTVEQSIQKHSSKGIQPEEKVKTKRGRKRTKNIQKEVGNVEQGDDEDDNGAGEEQDGDGAKIKEQVTCPECDKVMSSRGLKRHQVRCSNKNRFICPLCLHKSRESYDHTVHVDNHRTWVRAQPNWLGAPVDNAPSLLPDDSNSVTMAGEKEDYGSTVDLEELALITHPFQSELFQQHHQQLISSGLPTSQGSDVSLLPESLDQRGSSGEVLSTVMEDPKILDGGNKKTNPRDLKCKICYTWFGRTCLPKHMLQAHNMVKRFQCRVSTCREIFAKLEDFKDHNTVHSREDMFRCGCRSCINRRLVTPEKMNNIRKEKMRDYYKQMNHKCSKCWVKFPSIGSLDRHMKKESHHYPCSKCNKIQVSKRQLRMHMVTHQNERSFLCEVCGQNFKTKRDLNKHTFSHNNIRPFQCLECGKCFSFRNKMTRHMVTVHSVKKPFICDWPDCDKAFSRKDKLHDHAKTHLVAQPFRCQYCNKGFPRKDNVKDHEILHTQEFRFRCTVCDKGFMRPKILERHYQTDHLTPSTQVTLQAAITQDGQVDSSNPLISYVLYQEPHVYGNIDPLTTFQDSVQETDAQLMEGQHATIEAIQSAAAAVISGNGQSQYHIDGGDPFHVNITLGT